MSVVPIKELELLKGEIITDLQRELVLCDLDNKKKEDTEKAYKIILDNTKNTYVEALKNLYEDITEAEINKLVKLFELEMNKTYVDYLKN